MSKGLKILLSLADLALLLVIVAVLFAAFGLGDVISKIAQGAAFSWENFDPLSREPGALGITPLIWTALAAVPLAVFLPVAVYWFEKKQVPLGVRFALIRIRALTLLVLYLIIAGPALVDSEFFKEGSKVAVLIDDSLSMGAESREFSVFNVLDDRESAQVRTLSQKLESLGLTIGTPGSKGFVTLTDDELAVRNFVRKAVAERAERLLKRLTSLHGSRFEIAQWQRKQAEVETLQREADIKQSELSAELAKDETLQDPGTRRRLESELKGVLDRLQNSERGFADLLGGDVKDPKVAQKRALIENLLETVNAEGPRRWDIACELIASGNSLAVPTGDKASLLDLVKARAAEIEAGGDPKKMSKRRPMPALRYFVFSTKYGRGQATEEAILEVQAEELDFRAPRGRLTELDQALAEVRRYYTADDDLATIMVLSDGRDTSGERQEESRRHAATNKQSRRARATEVVTVCVGNPKPVKVLELLAVSGDKEVLKGDFVDFKLKIRADKAYRADKATGRAGQRIKVILCEDSPGNAIAYEELNGRPVVGPADMEFELPAEDLAEARVRFKPKLAGKHVYFLKLNEDRLADEDTYRNNVAEHYLEVIDRKIKVLYIEQGFRHEARWLNDNLKRDKKLLYQGYFIEADEGWPQPISLYDEEVKKQVSPLRAPFFDGKKIIREKDEFLKLNYDVLILGDIDPDGREFKIEHWDWIEEWVSKNQGGLILLSGMRYNPKAYANFERAKALYPVEIDNLPSDYDSRVDTRRLKYWRLTPAGRAHEVMRLSSNPERNDELLGSVVDGNFRPGQLDGLYWYAPGANLKPAPAQALVRVVNEGKVTSEGDVLVATQPYGNGVVLYVGTDDANRWRQFVGDIYFYRFWQNAIRFVASRRLAGKQQRVDVYTDKTEYQVGDQVKVYCELLGDIYGEVVQNQLKELKELPQPEGSAELRRIIVDVQARTGGKLTSRRVILSEVSWRPGQFEGIVEANEPGQFDVWVRGYEESRKKPHRYTVIAPIAELRDLTMDFDGLKARATELPKNRAPMSYQDGKRVYLMQDTGQAAIDMRERQNEVKGLSQLVWNTEGEPMLLRSLLLVAFVLLLAGEWFARKLVRLV
ncbi:MAG: hypothetical protein IT461_12545 [Planctomycetes bacterium]|jgi:hypothetical protein|nr:hypothetical protein [Planctomycetota bacterium]